MTVSHFFLWHPMHRVQRASWPCLFHLTPLPPPKAPPACRDREHKGVTPDRAFPHATEWGRLSWPGGLGSPEGRAFPLSCRSFDRCPPLCCRPFHRSFSNAYDLPSQKTQAEQQLRTRTSIGTGTETTRRQTNEVEFQGRISHVDSSNNGAMKVNGCQCFAIVPLANVKWFRYIIFRSHGVTIARYYYNYVKWLITITLLFSQMVITSRNAYVTGVFAFHYDQWKRWLFLRCD